MFRFKTIALPLALAGVAAAWAGVTLVAQEPKPAADAREAKPVDLANLREAVETSSKRGENVDDILKALEAFEKAAPNVKPGAVPPELQALRDAVDAAARKGENVESIAKELEEVEKAVVGRTLVKPKPEPPQPNPNPNRPFPIMPDRLPGGIDVEAFNKAMELRQKATELLLQNPRDPDALKLMMEANQMMLKAGGVGGLGGGNLFAGIDRARLGVRMDRVPEIAAEQLGLDANVGIAVTQVIPGSAAEKAGLKAHDIIIEFAGKPVSDNTEDFVRRVNEIKTGEKVDLVVLRKGKKVEVKGVEMPEAIRRPDRPLLPPRIDVPNIRPLPVPRVPPVAIPEGFDSVNFTNENGNFTLKAKKGDVLYVVAGGINEAGRVELTDVLVEAPDGRSHAGTAINKLPAEYQADVEKLLKTMEQRK